MGTKDRKRAKTTGLVHRDGQEVKRAKEKAPTPKCDVPHCGDRQAVPKINNLPLCQVHAERFLTQYYFQDKIEAARQAQQKPARKSGLYLPTGSNQERQALRDLAAGFNPRRR